MATDPLDPVALQQLQERQRALLDDIDRLRERGIGHDVGLPQLIVCGDQSSGKSSVLDAISRLRFPTDSGRCTRFATEVILRRDANPSVSVTIKPGRSRPISEYEKLQGFQHEFTDTARFPALVNEAKNAMGINDKAHLFTDDVLCVEVCGPDKPHLTLVDLPGLIHADPDNSDKVRELVESYMRNDRSVILAVVSAASDMANQIIFNLIRLHDPEGQRTMGIVTKPDLLDADSQQERDILQLVRNKHTPLRLGWHVLRNRAYKARDVTYMDRDREEQEFLSRRAWANIARQLKGVAALRKRLSDVLLSHIEHTLPDMIGEIREKRAECKEQLTRLGSSRATPAQQRRYLIDLSNRFAIIIREAREGQCLDAFFTDFEDARWSSRRLRAVIQKANHNFAQIMHEKGHKRQVTTSSKAVFFGPPTSLVQNLEASAGPWSLAGSGAGTIARDQLAEELDTFAEDIRDRALAGFPNPSLVSLLFRDQASPWRLLAETHLQSSWQAVKRLLQQALQHLTTDDVYRSLFTHLLDGWLNDRDAAMRKMLDLLVRTHEQGHPITYNPAFLSRKQESSTAEYIRTIRKNLGFSTTRNSVNEATYTAEHIKRALEISQSSDKFVSWDIIASTEAYYEIAMHTFIDNVASLVIEHCLVDELTNVFNPNVVDDMDGQMLANLAAESPDTLLERIELEERLNILDAGLATCLRHSVDNNSGYLDDDTESVMTAPYASLQQVLQIPAVNVHQQKNGPRRPSGKQPHANLSATSGEPIDRTHAESTRSPSPSRSGSQKAIPATGSERASSPAPSTYSTAVIGFSGSTVNTITPALNRIVKHPTVKPSHMLHSTMSKVKVRLPKTSPRDSSVLSESAAAPMFGSFLAAPGALPNKSDVSVFNSSSASPSPFDASNNASCTSSQSIVAPPMFSPSNTQAPIMLFGGNTPAEPGSASRKAANASGSPLNRSGEDSNFSSWPASKESKSVILFAPTTRGSIFQPTLERAWPTTESYQSITMQAPFRPRSFEELRLADTTMLQSRR